jgi:hypothetical protein
VSSSFPTTPISRNDSGFALQASLREKRSGQQLGDGLMRRNSAFSGFERFGTTRRPSQPTIGHQHQSSLSTSTLGNGQNYAPSIYAQSTLAASTIMPQMMIQPVRDDERTKWVEGHCLHRRSKDMRSICTVCDERCEQESFRCSGELSHDGIMDLR